MGGLCPSCKIQRGGGGGGGLCPSCKIHGGDYVHVYKNGQGGFVRGGGGGGDCVRIPTLSSNLDHDQARHSAQT